MVYDYLSMTSNQRLFQILRGFLFIPILFVGIGSLATVSETEEVPLSDVIPALEIKQNVKLLPPDQALALHLAKVSDECFHRKDVFVASNPDHRLAVNGVTSENVRQAIERSLAENNAWEDRAKNSCVQIMKTYLPDLKSQFQNKPYEWSWFLLNLGDKAAAKSLIMKTFNKSLETVMAAKGTFNYTTQTPLERQELEYVAASTLADKSERDFLSREIQQMREHVAELKLEHVGN